MSDTSSHHIGHDPEDPMDDMIRTIKEGAKVLAWALAIVMLVSLCSCKSHVCGVGESVWMHDTLTVYQQQRDSIYLHDSIYNEVRTSGDTVYVTRDRWRVQYKDRLKHDSIYISRMDTIVQQVEVPAKLGRIDKFEMMMGRVFVVIIGMIVLILLAAIAMRRVLR